MMVLETHDGGEVYVISKEEYGEIRERIMALVAEADPSIDPVDLLKELRQEGISRELGSTVMLEMIGAGYISRQAEDRQLSRNQEISAGVGIPAH